MTDSHPAPGAPPPTIDAIEDATRHYARARNVLRERMDDAEDALRAVRRRRIRGIKSAVAEAAARREALAALLAEAGPGAFAPPRRTLTVDGIKVGFRKRKGTTHIADEDATLGRIRKCLPEQADLLIKTTEKVVKAALGRLTVAELKQIGVEIAADTDEVVIAPTDSVLDKLVDALLAAAGQDAQDEPDATEVLA